MKRRYKKKFIQQLIAEENTTLTEYWKEYNLKHVVEKVSDAWAEVSSVTLKRAWNKLWPDAKPDPPPEKTECDDLTKELLTETQAVFSLDESDALDWVCNDDNELGYEILTDEQIVEVSLEDETDQTENEDCEYDGSEFTVGDVAAAKDSRKDAKEAASNMQKFMEWYEQQDDANYTDSMILRRMRNLAMKKSEAPVKQAKLTDFFSTS